MRNKLIKWLGGYTAQECSEEKIKGMKYATSCIKDKADSMYGLPVDEWAEKLYAYISKNV